MNEIVYKDKLITVKKVDKYYDFIFLGYKTRIHSSYSHIEDVIDKRTRAYDLIPAGAKIIPAPLVRICEGLFIGGVLEDSIEKVYGIARDDGIRGYSCSVYWIPSEEELGGFQNYNSLKGDFKIK